MANPAQRSGPSAAQLEKEREQRKYRKSRRKAREAAGEIKELNIVAMMDMMTILLVFLLKSYQATSINVDGSAMHLPTSTTDRNPVENITITLSLKDLRVNDRLVVETPGGIIPAQVKEGGKAEAFFVGPLYDALKKQVDLKKQVGAAVDDLAFRGQVNVVADKQISYRALMEVLYTAGQAELGEYKFMVMKNE